ncbi:MAG TPA: nuclear transport factor 2 family protein [Patescibacteria group bacterium]|nr:nuclear transport factor 2 family protein [Patescibacteria group bacterium]
MRAFTIFAATLVLAGCASSGRIAPPAQSVDARVDTVKAFVAAFNAHDATRMAALASPQIEWLSVDGRSVTVTSIGRAQLLSEMAAYFRGCPSCRSRIEQVVAAPERVVTVELAWWQGERGPREQSSVAVYEFDGARIRRVHYFPAEAASAAGSTGCTTRPC